MDLYLDPLEWCFVPDGSDKTNDEIFCAIRQPDGGVIWKSLARMLSNPLFEMLAQNGPSQPAPDLTRRPVTFEFELYSEVYVARLTEETVWLGFFASRHGEIEPGLTTAHHFDNDGRGKVWLEDGRHLTFIRAADGSRIEEIILVEAGD